MDQTRYRLHITCGPTSSFCCRTLLLSWPLGVAADDLNFVRLDRTRVVQLEVDVLDEESPYFVAETVGVQMTLCSVSELASNPNDSPAWCPMYFETQASLDLVGQYLRDSAVEVGENLHGKLRLNPTFVDKIIECIREG